MQLKRARRPRGVQERGEEERNRKEGNAESIDEGEIPETYGAGKFFMELNEFNCQKEIEFAKWGKTLKSRVSMIEPPR
jgi:hypothetical protein